MEIHENVNYLNNKAERGEKWKGCRKENNNSACADFDNENGHFNANPARNLIYEEIVDFKPDNCSDSKRFEVKEPKLENDGCENKAFSFEEKNLNEFPRKKLQSPKDMHVYTDTNFDFITKNKFFNDYKPLGEIEDDYSKIGSSSESDTEEHIYMEPNPLPIYSDVALASVKTKKKSDPQSESVYQNVTSKSTRPPSGLDMSDYDNLALYRRESSVIEGNQPPKLPPMNGRKLSGSQLRPLSADSANGSSPSTGIGKRPVPAKRTKKKSVLKKLSEEKKETRT